MNTQSGVFPVFPSLPDCERTPSPNVLHMVFVQLCDGPCHQSLSSQELEEVNRAVDPSANLVGVRHVFHSSLVEAKERRLLLAGLVESLECWVIIECTS